MRAALRLFASVKSTARYLEPGAPTGLAGLYTHSTPRATLLYLYSSTLDKLQQFPEHSVYRQSVEALTKHRMQLVQSVTPAGYDEYLAKTRQILAEHPEALEATQTRDAWGSKKNQSLFIVQQAKPVVDQRVQEWDGEVEGQDDLSANPPTQKVKDAKTGESKAIEWPEEPLLTADQYECQCESLLGSRLTHVHQDCRT